MLVEVTSADLLQVKWKGEGKATEFYHEWVAVESRIEAETMSSRARMNMLWNQLRQSEKVMFAVHKWSDKPEAERTYDELIERFRAWLVEQRSYQNYLKAIRRTDSSTPNVAGLQGDVGDKKAKDKKKKNDKKNASEGPKESSDLAAVVNGPGKGAGKKSGRDFKTKCLNFQQEYGMKGCFRKGCPYLHQQCETKEEFETLLNRVTTSKGSSSSEAENKANKNKAPSKGRDFRVKYCRYADGCKFKGTDKCKRDHTTYPTLEKWKAGLKAITGKDASSGTGSDTK